VPKNYVKKTVEERKIEIEQAKKAIEEGITDITQNSDSWKKMLEFSKHFHNYSFSNRLWLYIQSETKGLPLSQVAGYGTWQKLGRVVNKGEKAHYKVMAPILVKEDPTDPDNKEKRLIGYTVKSVFDISQTSGDPIPDFAPTRLTGEEGVEHIWNSVSKLIIEEGFAIGFDDSLGEVNGQTNFTSSTVSINPNLSRAQQAKTLTHELAHVVLHNPRNDTPAMPRSEREIEAESVSYILCTRYFDLPSEDYAFPYIAGWSGGDLKKVKASGDRIFKFADKLFERLDAIYALEEELLLA
jgi:hypothetical protein